MSPQETWMNKSKYKLNFAGYRQLNTSARKKRGGGTMMLIRNDMKFKKILIQNEGKTLNVY